MATSTVRSITSTSTYTYVHRKYKYEYKYFKTVLEYNNSSTSTSTKYVLHISIVCTVQIINSVYNRIFNTQFFSQTAPKKEKKLIHY